MKKIILLLLVIIPSLVFSQVDSSKYALPKRVAKEVVKDIVAGDSAKAILMLTIQQLKQTEDIIISKDISINKLNDKITDYQTQIKLDSTKTEVYIHQYKEQQKEIKKLKARKTFNNILHYVIMGVLGYLLITK